MASQKLNALPWGGMQASLLDGDRLHLQYGPIDLVIKAEGQSDDIRMAYAAAILRFETVLTELTDELSLLRKPLGRVMPVFRSAIATRMAEACWPYRHGFITPMAAVAGAVADTIKAVMLDAAPGLHTLYVNNGGDIALHVAPGQILRTGLVADLVKAIPDGVLTIDPSMAVGGIATSGWRGRSFSLGIADAVTVLASNAAFADAAATMIANAVTIKSPAIRRVPASSLDPDSDLGNRLVTTGVDLLTEDETHAALHEGYILAQKLEAAGFVYGAILALQDHVLCTFTTPGLPAK